MEIEADDLKEEKNEDGQIKVQKNHFKKHIKNFFRELPELSLSSFCQRKA